MRRTYLTHQATGGLDVRLSVFCGQVFRWTERLDGSLVGVDGDSWWLVTPADDGIFLEGSGEPSSFAKLFRLDEDWQEASAFVRGRVPELGPMMDALPGLRLMAPGDAVEETFSFLCTSNNHLSRIKSMVEKLSAYGPVLTELDGTRLYRFPTVEEIAAIPEGELRSQGFGYRAATIPRAAAQICEKGGQDWLRGLSYVSYEEARWSLLSLAGVGPKLADCICLFALGYTEAVPVDTHVWQAFTRLWFPELQGAPLTPARVELVTRPFRDLLGRHAGWAHQFLFYENLLNWRQRRASTGGPADLP